LRPGGEWLNTMRIAILNRLALDYAPYSRWLAPHRDDLILFNSKEKWRSHEEDAKDIAAEYNTIELIENYDLGGLLELKVLEHHRAKPIERILSNSEIDIIRAAKLREMLGIAGQSLKSATAYRDKVVMKTLALEAGIPVAAFAPVDCAMDLIDFVERNGYPVVLKPRTGAGSINTAVLRDPAALTTALTKGLTPILELAPNLMVETFVKGTMIHLDGIIENQQILISWPSVYLNGCLAFQSGDYLGSYLLGPDNPLVPRLKTFIKVLIAALPSPRNMVFHAEVFHTPEDQFVFCEIACRTGGAKVAEVTELAFGVNIREAWFRIETGVGYDRSRLTNTPAVQAGWLLFPPLPRTLVTIPDSCSLPGVRDYKATDKVGQRFEAGKTSVDQVAAFVIEGRSEAEVKSRILAAAHWFSENVIWD
jgi:hypothetical protein